MKFMGILSIELALEAVKQDGYALQYVPAESRTEAVALEAVKRNAYALRYVPAESCTEAVALEAVKQDGDALRYVLNFDLFVKIAAKLNISVEV